MSDSAEFQSFNLGEFAFVRGRIGWKGLKSDEYTDEGPYLVAGNHIKGDKIQWDQCQHISEFRYHESPEIKLKLNDIIISKDGTIGRLAIVNHLPGPTTINSTMMLVRLMGRNSLVSDYVFYFLQGEKFQKLVAERVAGSGVPHLFQADMKTLVVHAPEDINKQQKIAKILTTVDNLIEKTQALIDKYTAIKQGMMADLFTRGIDLSGTPETNPHYGQLRPPVDQAPELYKETELGWVPKEWKIEPIANLSIGGFKNGYFKDPKLLGEGLKLINVSELYQDFGIDITLEKVERIQISTKDYEKYKIEWGDIFFTRSSLVLEGIAKSNIVRSLPEPAIFECHVMRLQPNREMVAPEFLALYTNMPAARSYLMSMAKQVTMTTIAQPDMVGLPVPVPNLNEQQSIVARIDSVQRKIDAESKTKSKYTDIKKGLMQDLLTGKVKVKV